MPLLNVPRLARSDDRSHIMREPDRIARIIDFATRRPPVAGMKAISAAGGGACGHGQHGSAGDV